MKTDFMKLYEELDILNEDAQTDAASRFWAAAKNKQIDEESFYTAYEDEIKQLGLDSIFWTRKKEDGTVGIERLKHRGVYGDIKKAKEANPNSQAVKAVAKLWALQFVDNAKYQFEIKEKEAKARAEAERKAEVERLDKEESDAMIQACRDLLKEALTALKNKSDEERKELERYLKVFNITEDDIDFTIYKGWTNSKSINVLPSRATSFSVQNIYKNKDKLLEKLISELSTEFSVAVHRASRRSADVIDVFKENSQKEDYYCHAILQGESGKLYYVSRNSSYDMNYLKKTLGAEVVSIFNLGDIEEQYKVLYTEVSHSPRNYHTNRDTNSTTYYSWNSSKLSILKKLIPTIGSGQGSWSYWNTEVVESGDGKTYSLMDGIDSWAVEHHTSIATD